MVSSIFSKIANKLFLNHIALKKISVKQFLYGVAEIFYHHTGENIHNYAFVFPNRRAGIFFSKYLGDIAAKPIFSPHIF
ncbi:MAG: hypothetical protein RR141_07240, partial [Rikenellaceae bacterium]